MEKALKSILDEAEDYNKRNPSKLVTWYEEHAKTLNRQPRQSLDLLRAEVLEEVAVKKYDSGHGMFPHPWRKRLLSLAAELRNKAEVNHD